MSRKPQNKSSAIGSFSQSSESTTEVLRAALVRFNPDGSIDGQKKGKFLLNPNTWREGKSVNWASHNIPGQSDPPKQWVSGGPRTVSFEALFTKDFHTQGEEVGTLENLANKGLNAVSGIASNFFNVSIPPVQDLFADAPNTVGEEQLSIANELNYIRSLALPTYSEDGRLTNSPYLLALYVGKTFSSGTTAAKNDLEPLSEVWVLKNYSIQITKQLPNLVPMEAIVNIQLEQYIIESANAKNIFNPPKLFASEEKLPASNFNPFNIA